VALLNTLSDNLYNKFVNQNRGRVEEVLFESTVKGGMMYGYSRNYIRVEQAYDKGLIGKIVEVVI
jgi:threonylcarbamoyladenosine tRNA methylthiotransferase MtaB